jgi:hypothetical protein
MKRTDGGCTWKLDWWIFTIVDGVNNDWVEYEFDETVSVVGVSISVADERDRAEQRTGSDRY